MRLTDQEIKQAKAIKDPAVKKLLAFYEFVTASEVFDSYVTRMTVLRRWNKELEEATELRLINRKGDDSDNDLHDKAVDRCLKYLIDQPSYVEGSRKMFAMMTNQEQDQANKKLSDSKDLAFG